MCCRGEPPKSAGTRGDHHGTSPAGSGRCRASSRPQRDRPRSGSLGRRWLSLEGDVVALQGLAEPSRPSVRAGQATEVAGRRGPSRFRGPVAAGEQDQEARERADVLVVVADDRGKRFGRPAAQETEVAPGDLRPVDVTVADHPQQTRFDRPQPRVLEPVAEEAPDDRQQVQVAAVDRRGPAGHAVASDEQGPIEASAVVGHQPAVERDVAGQCGEERRFVGMIGEQQLDLVEGVALPPAEADEKGDSPGGRREPRRLGVQADERDPRWRLARQSRQTHAIERDLAWLGRAADDEAAGHRDHLATDRPGEALGQDTAVDRGVGQLDLAGSPRAAHRHPRGSSPGSGRAAVPGSRDRRRDSSSGHRENGHAPRRPELHQEP